MACAYIKNNKRENKHKTIGEIREYDCIWRQKAAVQRHIKTRRCARGIFLYAAAPCLAKCM